MIVCQTQKTRDALIKNTSDTVNKNVCYESYVCLDVIRSSVLVASF